MIVSDNQRRQSDPAQSRVNTQDLLGVTPAGVADVFLGEPRDYGPLRIYGGHFLAQALAGAFGTVAENKLAHWLHAYFLRPGIPDWPIQYRVDRLREGGGYETRAVRATQQGNAVFFMSASFKGPEEGDAHQPTFTAMGGPTAASGSSLTRLVRLLQMVAASIMDSSTRATCFYNACDT